MSLIGIFHRYTYIFHEYSSISVVFRYFGDSCDPTLMIDISGDLVWDLPCMQQASYLEGGPLVWMLPLYLHVNQKSNYDDKWWSFISHFQNFLNFWKLTLCEILNIWNKKICMEKIALLYCSNPKYWDRQTFANSEDTDQTPSDQGLQCLPFMQQFWDTSAIGLGICQLYRYDIGINTKWSIFDISFDIFAEVKTWFILFGLNVYQPCLPSNISIFYLTEIFSKK